MTIKRDDLAKADALTLATIETAVPRLTAARDLTHRFHSMIRSRDGAAFEPF